MREHCFAEGKSEAEGTSPVEGIVPQYPSKEDRADLMTRVSQESGTDQASLYSDEEGLRSSQEANSAGQYWGVHGQVQMCL